MLGAVVIEGKKVNVNLGMFCWLTKNMFKWSDRVTTDEADATEERPLKDMSDEELDT